MYKRLHPKLKRQSTRHVSEVTTIASEIFYWTTDQNRQLKNAIRKGSTSLILPHVEEKQDIIEDWLTERLSDKLRKATRVVQQTHKPHLLYRNTIEERKDTLQEEVCLLSPKHIVIMTYGGFVSSTFQKIHVCTSDKFIRWIIKEQQLTIHTNINSQTLSTGI